MSYFQGMIVSYCIVILAAMFIAITEWARPKLVAIALSVYLLATAYVVGVIIDAGII